MASLVVSGAAPGLRGVPFTLALIAVAVAIFAFGRWLDSSYAFFIGYVVVQYIVLGTAWNILGGYTGYVNFGITASSPSAPIRRWRCTSSCPLCPCRR